MGSSYFRFRLRTLIIASTVFAAAVALLGIGWFQDYVRGRAIRAIQEAGGVAVEDDELGVYRIYLSGTDFGDDQLREVVPHLQQFPELREIDLVRVVATDQGMDSLAAFHYLQVLYVFETHSGRIYCVAFDARGNTLATAAEDGVRIWNLTTNLNTSRDEQRHVSRIAFARHLDSIATTNAAGELHLLDLATAESKLVIRTAFGERDLLLPRTVD